MHRVFSVYVRKCLSVILIFNALLTISCVVGILAGVYFLYPGWKPFAPFLPDGNLFWLIIASAVINIFPAAHFGKVHTGRLWFHHYVYGFFVLASSVIWMVFFSSVSPLTIFFINSTSVAVNVGRFFFIAGLSLVLDDLPDVHRVTNSSLQWLKDKASEAGKILHITQFFMGLVALYFVGAVSLSISRNPQWVTAANYILIGSMLTTAFTSFFGVARKVWINLHYNQDI
jgi:hypothetical protein